MTNVHAWVRKEDETFEHLTFLDVTIAEAVERIGDQNIIAIFDEKNVVEGEFTYEQPSKPYNKTIWWYRPKVDPREQLMIDIARFGEMQERYDADRIEEE